MTRQYLVTTECISGLGDRTFRKGDLVKDENFPLGHADELVKQKFLRPINDEPEEEVKESKREKLK
jgi:hypothetical protein